MTGEEFQLVGTFSVFFTLTILLRIPMAGMTVANIVTLHLVVCSLSEMWPVLEQCLVLWRFTETSSHFGGIVYASGGTLHLDCNAELCMFGFSTTFPHVDILPPSRRRRHVKRPLSTNAV